MFFLTPSHVKHGRQFIKDAKKLLAYKRDLVSEQTAEDVRREIGHMEVAVASRERTAIEAQAQRLDEACGKLTKPVPNAGLRENVEVFLVAIVIALGVRTFFLQPFTIPTGSMQPTLNGILATPTEQAPPNLLVRAAHKVAFGRTYLDIAAKADEIILRVEEMKRPLLGRIALFTETRLTSSAGNIYWVDAPRAAVLNSLLQPLGFQYRAGEPLVRGYVDTGDHVFVDKVSYHFRAPKRGEVFVFSTQNVPTQDNLDHPNGPLAFEWKEAGPLRLRGPVDPERGSQYYIKRLAGLPGDTLRIDAPALFVNGERARGTPFERVMSMQDGYRGYANLWQLARPNMTMTAPNGPDRGYFALGDNSYNSSDSRHWGAVPEKNLMGRGVFVYWPFTRHWGGIR